MEYGYNYDYIYQSTEILQKPPTFPLHLNMKLKIELYPFLEQML